MATARTVTQVIQATLRVLGILAAGETVNANDTTTGLEALQDLISSWSGIGLTVPYVTSESQTLTGSKASYTIGENGSPDWSTVRPLSIDGAFIRDSSGYDHPVKIIGEREYRQFVSKTTESRPDRLYYAPTNPNGTIYLWTVPSSAEDLYISTRKPLTDPAQLTDNLQLQPGSRGTRIWP